MIFYPKTYNLNVRQGSRCVQTIRQASEMEKQSGGCPECALRMAQTKNICPEALADFIQHRRFSQVLDRVVCLLRYHHTQADASVWFDFEPSLEYGQHVSGALFIVFIVKQMRH